MVWMIKVLGHAEERRSNTTTHTTTHDELCFSWTASIVTAGEGLGGCPTDGV